MGTYTNLHLFGLDNKSVNHYITIDGNVYPKNGVIAAGQTGARANARAWEWEQVTMMLLRQRLGPYLADQDSLVFEYEPPEKRLADYFETTPLFATFRELQQRRSEPSEEELIPFNGSLMHWYWAPRGWWPSVLYQAHERARLWEMLLRQEKRRGRRYDWVVASRLDLGWLAPHPPLSKIFADAATDTVAVQDGFDFGGVNDRHAVMPRHSALYYMGDEESWRSNDFAQVVRQWLESSDWPNLRERAVGAERLLLLRLCWAGVTVRRFSPVAALTCPEFATFGAARLLELEAEFIKDGLGVCEFTGGFRHPAEYNDASNVAVRLEYGWEWTWGYRQLHPPPYPCGFVYEECCLDACAEGICFLGKHSSVARCCNQKMLIVAPTIAGAAGNMTDACWALEEHQGGLNIRICSQRDED